MKSVLTRRQLMGASSAIAVTSLIPVSSRAGSDDFKRTELTAQIEKIEGESGGRLGVAVIDTQTGLESGHRLDERFPLCSTFKLLAASAILKRVEEGKESLERRIRFTSDDVVAYSPKTKQHIGGGGMPLSDICEAALTLSDNTAGNLMLASLGGPAGVTAFARSIGDTVSRLDRMETALNEALPGDVRDTTSPRAMAHDIQNLVLGPVLSDASKATLTAWLRANKTSDKRFRAAVPKDWIVGDKTGSGDRGSTNDVGVVWPPARKPLIVAVYLTDTAASPDSCNETVVKVMRTVATVS